MIAINDERTCTWDDIAEALAAGGPALRDPLNEGLLRCGLFDRVSLEHDTKPGERRVVEDILRNAWRVWSDYKDDAVLPTTAQLADLAASAYVGLHPGPPSLMADMQHFPLYYHETPRHKVDRPTPHGYALAATLDLAQDLAEREIKYLRTAAGRD